MGDPANRAFDDACAAFGSKRIAAAIRHLETCLKHVKSLPSSEGDLLECDAQLLSSTCYSSLDDGPTALRFAEAASISAKAHNRDDAFVMKMRGSCDYNLASLYYRYYRPIEALATAEGAVHWLERDASRAEMLGDAHVLLATLYRDSGQYVAAQSSFHRAKLAGELHGSNTAAISMAEADLLELTGSFEQSLASIREALRLNDFHCGVVSKPASASRIRLAAFFIRYHPDNSETVQLLDRARSTLVSSGTGKFTCFRSSSHMRRKHARASRQGARGARSLPARHHHHA